MHTNYLWKYRKRLNRSQVPKIQKSQGHIEEEGPDSESEFMPINSSGQVSDSWLSPVINSCKLGMFSNNQF